MAFHRIKFLLILLHNEAFRIFFLNPKLWCIACIIVPVDAACVGPNSLESRYTFN